MEDKVIAEPGVENTETGESLMDKRIDELNKKIEKVVESQSKMIDVIQRTNEMQITMPQSVVLSDSETPQEQAVNSIINEWKQDINRKYRAGVESWKAGLIFEYLHGKDVKTLAKIFEDEIVRNYKM